MEDPRALARELAAQAREAGKPLDWFETLYARAAAEGVAIPWADRAPNPNLIKLYEKVRHLPFGVEALCVGCGLGDDAEWLASQGFHVMAFDISPTAIAECRRRFPGTKVDYVQADLFAAPASWNKAFDVVQESYTIQALPLEMRADAIARIAGFVAPGGYLLLNARARDEADPPGEMPWPLTRRDLDSLLSHDLVEVYFQDSHDRDEAKTRRFRACYGRRG